MKWRPQLYLSRASSEYWMSSSSLKDSERQGKVGQVMIDRICCVLGAVSVFASFCLIFLRISILPLILRGCWFVEIDCICASEFSHPLAPHFQESLLTALPYRVFDENTEETMWIPNLSDIQPSLMLSAFFHACWRPREQRFVVCFKEKRKNIQFRNYDIRVKANCPSGRLHGVVERYGFLFFISLFLYQDCRIVILLHPMWAVWPWTSYLNFLSFCFLIFNVAKRIGHL